MMTRKDYQRIATVLNMERIAKGDNPEVDASIRMIMAELCLWFAGDNPRFDMDKFITACGYGERHVTKN